MREDFRQGVLALIERNATLPLSTTRPPDDGLAPSLIAEAPAGATAAARKARVQRREFSFSAAAPRVPSGPGCRASQSTHPSRLLKAHPSRQRDCQSPLRQSVLNPAKRRRHRALMGQAPAPRGPSNLRRASHPWPASQFRNPAVLRRAHRSISPMQGRPALCPRG